MLGGREGAVELGIDQGKDRIGRRQDDEVLPLGEDRFAPDDERDVGPVIPGLDVRRGRTGPK